MSKIKVDQVEQRSGATVTVGGGACKTAVIDATTVTLGRSGATVSLACGATQSGFGRTGTVDWCTTAKTSPLTAVSGKGYMVNTCAGSVTVTLPTSPSAGDIVSIADYKSTFQTNQLVVGRGGSKINGDSNDAYLTTKGQSVTMVYIDATQGWKSVQDSTSDVTGAPVYNVQYLVIAGGAGGGTNYGGGGGAGGFRTIPGKTFSVTSGDSYTITVGGGGAGAPNPASPFRGVNGSPSIFSSITSAGGGAGSGGCGAASDGGSGGGGGRSPSGSMSTQGSGNVPPVSPPQGNPGSTSVPAGAGGGGGGAAAAGGGSGKCGGAGSPFGGLGPLAPSYGTPGPAPGKYFSGGGGGYADGVGGSGGGGSAPAAAGGANTGGGGSGCSAGGSGFVAIRYVTACASPTVAGGNANATCSSDTIRVFTADGTFTA